MIDQQSGDLEAGGDDGQVLVNEEGSVSSQFFIIDKLLPIQGNKITSTTPQAMRSPGCLPGVGQDAHKILQHLHQAAERFPPGFFPEVTLNNRAFLGLSLARHFQFPEEPERWPGAGWPPLRPA
jgi:hypothetical protein